MRLLQHMMAIAVIVVMVMLLVIAIRVHVVQVLVVLVATVMAHVTAPLVMPNSLYLAARVALAGRRSQTSLLVAEVTTAAHHKTRSIKHNQLAFFVWYFGSTQRLVMYTCAYFKAFARRFQRMLVAWHNYVHARA